MTQKNFTERSFLRLARVFMFAVYSTEVYGIPRVKLKIM